MVDLELDFLKELQEIYLQESAEHLATLESLFLTLEKDHENRAVLDKIFRIMHTLKGSGNAVGFENLGSFAHICEELLVKIIRKDLDASGEVIDILLCANGMLKTMHEGLKSDPAFQLDSCAMRDRIQAILGQSPKEAAAMQSRTYVPSPQKAKQEAAAEALTPEDCGLQLFDDMPAKAEKSAARATSSPETPSAADEPAVVKKAAQEQTGGKDESIRLPLRKIDDILNNFGEQVILQAILEHALKDPLKNKELIHKTISNMGKITYDLQQTAIALRMVSLKMFFNQMKRTSRDTAKQLGKEVEFVCIGDDTELDKTIVDNLSGVIVHVIRNAIDHGIEAPDVRQEKGKNAQGTLTVEASSEGGYFFLRISDDGAGLDREAVLRKAREKGLISPDARPSDEEIDNFIFLSGFSTKSEATSVSGRGVGMDAVKVVVEEMRGQINLNSTKDKGSVFTIKLPLSMAIFNGMLLTLGDKKYVIPNSEIKEIYRFGEKDVRVLDASDAILRKGDHTVALVDMHQLVGLTQKAAERKRRVALIVMKNHKEMALEVDEVIGQQRIVQKKLGGEIEGMCGLAGGAILGDGTIALILNVNDLIGRHMQCA